MTQTTQTTTGTATKKFMVEKRGKISFVLIRQMAHDPQYKIGSHIPSYGKVVGILEVQ